MQQHIMLSKVAIQTAIRELSTILQTSPEKMVEQLDRSQFTDPNENEFNQKPIDARYICCRLGRALESILEARNELIDLGFYNFGETNEKTKADLYCQKPDSRVETRESIPDCMEQTRPDTDTDSVSLSPD